MSNTRIPAPPYFRLLPPPTPGSTAYRKRCLCCARAGSTAAAIARPATSVKRWRSVTSISSRLTSVDPELRMPARRSGPAARGRRRGLLAAGAIAERRLCGRDPLVVAVDGELAARARELRLPIHRVRLRSQVREHVM